MSIQALKIYVGLLESSENSLEALELEVNHSTKPVHWK